MLFLFLALISCRAEWYFAEFPRDRFENEWWEIQEEDPPVCFNVHESGDLLTYGGQISNEGEWTFSEPNIYEIEDEPYEFKIWSDPQTNGEECWKIKVSTLNKLACQCTILEWLE